MTKPVDLAAFRRTGIQHAYNAADSRQRAAEQEIEKARVFQAEQAEIKIAAARKATRVKVLARRRQMYDEAQRGCLSPERRAELAVWDRIDDPNPNPMEKD